MLSAFLAFQLLATQPVGPSFLRASSVETERAALDVRPNDNRASGGTLSAGVLRLKLDVVVGDWQPEGPGGPTLQFPVFREQGKTPQIPGPMIRVAAGTTVRVTIHNTLERTLCIRGLQDRGAAALDTFDIAPGGTREVEFQATTPGTFFYWGRTRAVTNNNDGAIPTDEAHLVGALVVDPPGSRPPPGERIMVITSFFDTLETPALQRKRYEVLAINGLTWPHTERLHYTAGDTVHWRVINAGSIVHPMHLHGFYFRVNSKGDRVRDTVFTAPQRRMAVTEFMAPNTTMSMTWVPTRPGNWLFHCHLIYHIAADLRLTRAQAGGGQASHQGHAEHEMAGLVMAIHVKPAPGVKLAGEPGARRKLRLFINQRENVFGTRPGLSFILQEGDTPPPKDSVHFPSSTIVLHRDEPTEITVINQTPWTSSTHWHGIELESYYDGVAGFSGAGRTVAPPIAPGDSFVVRMTPDRAGTFIYHTHSDEAMQLNSGLYGTLLVLEPGAQRDPDERIFLMGEGGPERGAIPFVNGSASAPAVELRAGVRHRFRLINISAAAVKRVQLLGDNGIQQWRPFAKDGFDLPARQASVRTASVDLGPGETVDVEVVRRGNEQLTLDIITAPLSRTPRSQKIPVMVR
jgi:FtsP/CotA-like multicopper oxidase with cupredoxin domain